MERALLLQKGLSHHQTVNLPMYCPECAAITIPLLKAASHTSSTNHFTCTVCGFAWAEPKDFDLADDDPDDVDESYVVVH